MRFRWIYLRRLSPSKLGTEMCGAEYYGFIDSSLGGFTGLDKFKEWGLEKYIVYVGDPTSNQIHEDYDQTKLQLIVMKQLPEEVRKRLRTMEWKDSSNDF